MSPADDVSTTAERLRAAAAAAGLVLGVDDAERLLAYLALLQRWNRVYNLTALRDAQSMFSHHLLDCLAVVPALRAGLGKAADGPLRVLDVGSGGGLPGVVLALLQPDWRVDCVDAVGKKAGFIRQVAAELRLPRLRGLHARVEALPAGDAGYGMITSRAFASLADFTALTMPLLAQDGVWVAMKGRAPREEIEALPPSVQVFHVEQLQVPGLDAQRHLVWMRPAAGA